MARADWLKVHTRTVWGHKRIWLDGDEAFYFNSSGTYSKQLQRGFSSIFFNIRIYITPYWRLRQLISL